jgi:antitoxin component YwqK of YwqJK toxin-antitoxin module
MKKLFVSLILILAGIQPALGSQPNSTALLMTLKPRQPNWRIEVVKMYSHGTPNVIVFYEPTLEGGERPVKQVTFHENSRIQIEMDVAVVDEESRGAKEWNSKIVPHGTRVDFNQEGQLVRVAAYQFGLLDGECKTFYGQGKIQNEATYLLGNLNGAAKSYYEDGKLKEEAYYENGLLEGEVIQYHSNGNRAALVPHHEGKVHGVAMNWFPSGILNVQRQFSEGILHGDGKNPAFIVYDEARNIVEVLDFRKGQPVGLHIRYHANGIESYRLNYKNGKKEGKEQFFAEDGVLLGEGLFRDGMAIGKHFRNHPNGTLAYEAHFDERGALLQPVVEFNQNGQKIRQFFAVGEKLTGPYFEWYDDGVPKVEYNYALGEYDGEQKEYYPSGQLKVATRYVDQKREGAHEEWHENGVLARKLHFHEGLKDGQMGEWFSNGNARLDAYFQADRPDGIQSEWYENGQLKVRSEFVSGLKQGWQREWSDQGDLLLEALFENDQMQGTMLSWWNRDQIKTRFQFDKGKKEGIHKWFYKDGKPERVATFKNDLMEGEMLSWYPDGAIQSVQFFKEGKPIGEHRTYFPKSGSSQKDEERLAHLFNYDDQGQMHGEERTYYQDGKLQTIVSYFHGAVDGKRQVFDAQGNLIEEANYVRGKLEGSYFQKTPEGRELLAHYHNNLKNGPHLIFHPVNQKGEKFKAVETFFENDQIEGIVYEYSDRGKKIAETPYVHGKKEGLAKIYSADSKISITVEFSADKKSGLATQYAPNGALFRTTSYIDDLKNGEEVTYHENGKVATVFNYHNDQLNGIAYGWSPEGILTFEAEYMDGLRHGKLNKYYEDGKPYLEQMFAYDKLEGEKRKYQRDGSLTISYYEDGELMKMVR